MKKLLLSLMTLALVHTGAMAYRGGDSNITCTVDDTNGGVQKIVSTQAGGFATFLANSDFNQYMERTDVSFSGPMSTADLQAMTAACWNNVRFLDFSNVTGLTADDIDNKLPTSNEHRACLIIMPKTVDVTPAIVKDVFQARIGGNNGNRNYGFFMGGSTGVINVLENLAYNAVFSDFVTGLKYIYTTDENVGGLCFHYSYASTDAVNYPTYGGEVSYEWGGSFYTGFFDAMKQIPCSNLDLSGVNAAAVGYDFGVFNPNTHYFVLPINTNNATVNFSDESSTTQSKIKYTDNVWVVANVKGTKWGDGTTNCPYSTDYRDINTSNLGESAVITYVRKAGELVNAGRWASNEIKNSKHNVILGKLNSTDLGNMTIMNNTCMDLSYAKFVDGATANDLTCYNAKYVALPYNTTKEDVDKAYNKLSATGELLCVGAFAKEALAATETTQAVPANTLITYSKEAGQVDHVQFMVNALSGNRATNVNNVIMSGNLNAQDICNDWSSGKTAGLCVGTDGHLYYSDNMPEGVSASTDTHGTLFGANLSLADFTNAIFEQPTTTELEAYKKHCPQYYTAEEKKDLMTDMNFAALGNTNMSTLLLPTDDSQKVIPANFLGSDVRLTEICIPSNFEYIMDYAFNGVGPKLGHVYTTADENDVNLVETAVDNGWSENMSWNGSAWTGTDIWGTYTIASTVKYIAVGAFDTNTTSPLKDVFVLAKDAPVCEKDAFNSNKFFGNNGFNNTNPISRDNYKNAETWIAVLHFPNALDDEAKKPYTDIEREYWYVDETGAVDGDGNPLSWPCHTEFMRSWHQALTGYTWNDWSKNRCTVEGDGRYGQIFAVGGQDADIPDTQTTIAVENSAWDDTKNSFEGINTTTTYNNVRSDCDKCDFASYIGWHQFLLAQPGYFYEHKSEEYKQTPWYTFCIPFDMTYDELKQYLGVPDDALSNAGKMPEVRTLRHVIRYTDAVPELKKNKDLVSILISKDLVENNADVRTYGQTETKKEGELVAITHTKVVNGVEKPVYVKGGYPYIVRGWVPKSQPIPENLGKYVLAKAQFDTYDLGNVAYLNAAGSDTTSTGFYNRTDEDGFVAMPYFNHTVDAWDYTNGNFYGARDEATIKYKGKDGKTYDFDYKYNFCGHYESGQVYNPQYSYYMNNKGVFKRCTTEADSKWDIYNCVITHHGEGIPLSILISEAYNWRSAYIKVLTDHTWAGKYGEYQESEITENGSTSGTEGNTNFVVLFDEEAEGMADGIVNLEILKEMNQTNKVYNINGQYVGSSLNGLCKGIYVINGKKYIVK